MQAKSKQQVVINHRSANTGKFVTERYAKTHPSTTVTERNKVPTKSK
jgi:hypothetical protein